MGAGCGALQVQGVRVGDVRSNIISLLDISRRDSLLNPGIGPQVVLRVSSHDSGLLDGEILGDLPSAKCLFDERPQKTRSLHFRGLVNRDSLGHSVRDLRQGQFHRVSTRLSWFTNECFRVERSRSRVRNIVQDRAITRPTRRFARYFCPTCRTFPSTSSAASYFSSYRCSSFWSCTRGWD